MQTKCYPQTQERKTNNVICKPHGFEPSAGICPKLLIGFLAANLFFFLFHCLQLISQTNLDLIRMLKAKKYMIWSPMTFNLALGIILSEYNLMQLSSYRQSEQAIFSQFALYALQTNMFEFVDFVLVFSCKL